MAQDGRITVYLLAPGDRPHHQAQWVEPGTTRRRTRSLRTADPDLAERLRGDLEYELNHGLADLAARVGWADFRRRYFDERLSLRKPGTRAKAGYVFDHFERLMRPADVGGVTGAVLNAYAGRLRAAEYRPASVQAHLAYLRAGLRWAAKQGLVRAAPPVDMPAVPRRRRFRTLAADRLPALLAAMPTDAWRLLVLVAWHTGMRRTEMLLLRWDRDDRDPAPWADLEAGRVWLPPEATKSGRDEWVPIHPDLLQVLERARRPAGRVFSLSPSPRHVSRVFGRLARAAGLDVTLHDLRRSFGTRYAPLVPAQVLRRLMRHASIQTTLEFYADIDGALEEAIRRA